MCPGGLPRSALGSEAAAGTDSEKEKHLQCFNKFLGAPSGAVRGSCSPYTNKMIKVITSELLKEEAPNKKEGGEEMSRRIVFFACKLYIGTPAKKRKSLRISISAA